MELLQKVFGFNISIRINIKYILILLPIFQQLLISILQPLNLIIWIQLLYKKLINRNKH